ncbi:MAG: diaminopimelate decarboxylase [Hyphomicrobiaceae bacterium]|jgi:diaminopimelate decarboxylase
MSDDSTGGPQRRAGTHPERPLLRAAIAGQSVTALVERFGTPVYVYDAATIEERIVDFARFDVVRFAQKACSNIAILDLCRRNGVVVDAVSAGEIHRALVAGYKAGSDPAEIVYTADIFDRAALELCLEHDIPVNCGSIDMIDQYGRLAAGREITLRLNPGFGHGHSKKTNTGGEQSKHGIWHEHLTDALERAAHHELVVAGVHVHIGSGSDMEHLSQVCDAVERLALEVGDSVTAISAGGGVPIPYQAEDVYPDLDAYFELWDATRQRLAAKFGHPVRLEIEPGRYLVAEAGNLIAEVRATKGMGNNRFVLVDAGFNNLARPVMYGAYQPMALTPARGDGADRDVVDVIVGGPLCESGDIFTQGEGGMVRTQPLPEAKIGDFLIIGCAGAYGATMGSNYNSKPLAAEVLIEGGQAHLVRSRQTLEDLVRGERIPERDT